MQKSQLIYSIFCLILVLILTCHAIPVDGKTSIDKTTINISLTKPALSQNEDVTTLLTKEKWSLLSIVQNGKSVSLIPGTMITANFSPDGKVNGKAGCNNYFGSYRLSRTKISIGQVGSTRMFCAEPRGLMKQESLYTSMLTKVSVVSVTDSNLSLRDSKAKNILFFQKYTPPSIQGSWVLDSISVNNTVSRIIPGSNVTAEFLPDGNLAGSSGCNHYNSKYQVNNDRLSLSPVVSTLMYCSEPEGIMEQETMYLNNLGNVSGYAIENDSLRLIDEKGKALLFYFPAKSQ